MPPGRAGYRQAVSAEWTKFWSVRSTPWSLAVLIVITIGLGAISTNAMRTLPFAFSDPTRRILLGFNLGQFAIGVLGVLFISAEFGTGQIRSTLAAMPRRRVVLGAKALVMGAVALVMGEFLAFSTFIICHFILVGSPSHVSLGDPNVVAALVRSGVYVALMSLLGLGIASILRNTAGSISAFAGVLLVLPLVIGAFPKAIVNAVSRYLPLNIGVTIFSAKPRFYQGIQYFSPTVGLLVLALYALVLLSLGGWLMTRRDT
jgi:ABC-2 type transport system permease protein